MRKGGLPFRTSALRGEEVTSKADIVSNLSKGGCVNLRTGGVKKSEIFADVLNGSPQRGRRTRERLSKAKVTCARKKSDGINGTDPTHCATKQRSALEKKSAHQPIMARQEFH